MKAKTRNPQTLGRRIAAARTAAGLSKSEAARRAGIPGGYGTWHRWESDRMVPDLHTLRRIAETLGVEPGSLI